MFTIDDILSIRTEEEFSRAALELFAHQAAENPVYREYLARLGVDPGTVADVDNIPFLPIELFKSHNVWCGGGEPDVVFTSSTTGGGEPSRHPMRDVGEYRRTFRRAFELFYGPASAVSIYALLPGYLERPGSSLVYMVDDLVSQNSTGHGGFYLRDLDTLLRDMARDPGPKILLGVSYALWDLAEQRRPNLHGVTVMETGGMKGVREELPRSDLHAILCDAFGVDRIHSEYGMAELTSQAYSTGHGLFRTPPWMRVAVRDVNDPFSAPGPGQRGGVNIIDLANLSSCAFIQTRDLGSTTPDGRFMIHGRIDHSEIRGCNLLLDN